MAQTIYGLTRVCGLFSAEVQWFKDKALVDEILNDDNDTDEYEEYVLNSGRPAVTLTFPDEFDLGACGFHFSTKG